MSEPLLSARGLKKTYVMGRRTLEVLRGVDLDIQRGGFVALCGSSGTGNLAAFDWRIGCAERG